MLSAALKILSINEEPKIGPACTLYWTFYKPTNRTIQTFQTNAVGRRIVISN